MSSLWISRKSNPERADSRFRYAWIRIITQLFISGMPQNSSVYKNEIGTVIPEEVFWKLKVKAFTK